VLSDRVGCPQTAEEGAGGALELEPIALLRERAGSICRPIALTCPTGARWLVYPKASRRSRALETFRRWLLTNLARKTSWKHVDGGAPTHGLILVAMSEAPGGTGSIGKLHRRDAVAILEMTRESALIAKSDSCRRLRN
jgi:hypothetical protein